METRLVLKAPDMLTRKEYSAARQLWCEPGFTGPSGPAHPGRAIH